MRFCKLKEKEVINITDGKSLGYISDVVLDCTCGKICSIVVPGHCGFGSLFHPKSYLIPWNCIIKIGSDVILVETDLGICRVYQE